MSTIQHISMRVPWRDQPWDQQTLTAEDSLPDELCDALTLIN